MKLNGNRCKYCKAEIPYAVPANAAICKACHLDPIVQRRERDYWTKIYAQDDDRLK